MVQKHGRRAWKLTSCRFRYSENAIFGKHGFRKSIPETHSKLFCICGLLTSSIGSSCWSISWVFQVPAVNPSQVQFCGVSTAKPKQNIFVELQLQLVSCQLTCRELSWQGRLQTIPNSIQHLGPWASLKLLQHLHNVAWRSITSIRQPTWTLLAHPIPPHPTPPHALT